jgi:UDP-glucose:(heptosyl)LPS alpha-1,3-glucosyltransferase
MPPDKRLAIAFVRRGYSQSGGAEAYLRRLAWGVLDAGHDVHLITTNDWPQTEWPFGTLHRLHYQSAIAFANELKQMRPRIPCDVLMSLERVWDCHVYRAGDGVHRAWLARKRKFELPLERFVRGFNRKHREILQLEEALLANRGAGRVIVNSHMVKNQIVDHYGYPADKIDIVRNGVPIQQFRFDTELREKARDELKIKPDQIALLFAGSGWERKGLRFAIAAMALCRNRKMHLLVAGRGNQRYYKSKRVKFLGEVDDLVRIYAAADIFILPTIYDPFSNACLEALACGLPVITTRDNGFNEIIEHGVHGSIADSTNDLMGLRDAIQFWSDAERRAATRSTNSQRAAQFDISMNVARVLEILVQAAANAASTSGKIRNT